MQPHVRKMIARSAQVKNLHGHILDHFEALSQADAHVYEMMERQVPIKRKGRPEELSKTNKPELVVTHADETFLRYAQKFTHDETVRRICDRALAGLKFQPRPVDPPEVKPTDEVKAE